MLRQLNILMNPINSPRERTKNQHLVDHLCTVNIAPQFSFVGVHANECSFLEITAYFQYYREIFIVKMVSIKQMQAHFLHLRVCVCACVCVRNVSVLLPQEQ